jgi:hypothetical protein
MGQHGQESTIFLNYILIKILKGDTLSQEDSSDLQDIVLTCILDEGNNSMIAKGMLMAYYHLEFGDGHEECEEEELVNTNDERVEREYFNSLFSFDPMIDLNSNLTKLTLYDSYGKKIKEKVKYSDLKNISLIPGLYFVSIQNGNKIFKTVKIWLPMK